MKIDVLNRNTGCCCVCDDLFGLFAICPYQGLNVCTATAASGSASSMHDGSAAGTPFASAMPFPRILSALSRRSPARFFRDLAQYTETVRDIPGWEVTGDKKNAGPPDIINKQGRSAGSKGFLQRIDMIPQILFCP